MVRRSIFPMLLFILAIVYLAPGAFAAPPDAKPAQRAAQPDLNSFVWTNDEVDMLHQSNVPISVVGPQLDSTASVVAAAPGELESYDRTKDPAWYAEQAAILRAEMDTRQAELTQQVKAVADARNLRQSDPGVAMDRGNAGITPEAGIDNLEAQVREVQDQLDALADLARQNDIPAGVLRG